MPRRAIKCASGWNAIEFFVPRKVEPEILDSLRPNHPDALRSRRDLRRLNRWMRNETHLLKAIRQLNSKPATILEAGCGDGTFMLSLARRLQREWSHPVRIYLLDMEPVVSAETIAAFARFGWEVNILAAKIQEWIGRPGLPAIDLVFGNLFWHHLTDEELRSVFAGMSGITTSFIACEPRRWLPSLIATRLLWAIGCSRVTIHDGIVSVRAGFRDSELSALWPRDSNLKTNEFSPGWATHMFVVERAKG